MKTRTDALMALLIGPLLASCSWGLMEQPGDGEAQEVEDPAVDDGNVETDTDGQDHADRQDPADIDAVEQVEVQDVDLIDPAQEDTQADDGPGEPDETEPEPVEPVCGNSILETGEDCDDGPLNSDTEPDACRRDCTNAHCGDGVVDTGETCDDASGFCVTCQLTAPDGWVACIATDGSIVFLQVVDWAGDHTWVEFNDYCRTLIEGSAPVDYDFYGLAVFSDSAIWDCISGSLSGTQYYIGLKQDRTAGDYGEPAGGWYWVGYNGSSWYNVAPYSGGSVTGSFDNGGGSGEVDCGRLYSDGTFYDYTCTGAEPWDGICMIQF